MIICPNCNGENADESAHCGHCGHQLQEGGKKTMFGMAALDSNQLQKAAEEAKAARAATAPPSLNLPPSGGDGADAFAKTEMMDSVSATAAQDAPEDPFADDFAALEKQYGDEPPVDPTPGAPPVAAPPAAGPPASAPPMSAPPTSAPPMGGPMMSPPIDDMAPKKKSNTPIIIGIVAAVMMLGCGGAGLVGYLLFGT